MNAAALTSLRHAAWTLLILNVLDIVFTVLALRAGAHEGNPLADWLIGTNLIWPAKIVVPGSVLFSAYWSRTIPKITELSVRRAWFVVGVYVLVVVLNVFTWRRYAG